MSKLPSPNGSRSAPATAKPSCRWRPTARSAAPAASMGSLRSTPTTWAPVRLATARAMPAWPGGHVEYPARPCGGDAVDHGAAPAPVLAE